MTHWLSVLRELRTTDTSSVLVTVAGIRGSTPRETGASMIVTESSSIGTIGGGQLEHQATRHAVEMLTASRDRQRNLRRYVLGANCGQCCGGVAEVLFEYLPGSRSDWLEDALQRYEMREAFVLVTPLSDSPWCQRIARNGWRSSASNAWRSRG